MSVASGNTRNSPVPSPNHKQHDDPPITSQAVTLADVFKEIRGVRDQVMKMETELKHIKKHAERIEGVVVEKEASQKHLMKRLEDAIDSNTELIGTFNWCGGNQVGVSPNLLD